MTTLIITVISILLAAVCALMIVFFGGDLFHSGMSSAQADTYMNAGHNVIAAVDQYRLDNRNDPPDLSALIDGGFLSGYPYVGRSFITQDIAGTRLTIEGVDPTVCGQINEVLKRPATEWGGAGANSNIGDGGMGCQMKGSTGTFYAMT